MMNKGNKFLIVFLSILLNFFVFGQTLAVNSLDFVSKSTAGVLANQYSDDPQMSADGRYVVFHSPATNLVTGDTNGFQDIFLRDTQLNTTTRISVSTAGAEGNDTSFNADISDDGRYVVFNSLATNLVAGDTNGMRDVFVRDTQLNTTTRVSVSTAGVEANSLLNGSERPSISSTGRYIFFTSDATNLVAGDTNSKIDAFVRDTQLNTTTRVSVSTAGVEANDDVSQLQGFVSTNGRYVVFHSPATNLVAGDTNNAVDVFIRDTQLNTTTRVSVSTAGVEADQGVALDPVAMSDDAKYIIFTSGSTNLVAGDNNGFIDLFLRDTINNTTELISINSLSAQSDADSYTYGGISNDGRYVGFSSDATNLVSGDTNGFTDIFLRDRQNGTTTIISVPILGGEADEGSYGVKISDDASIIIFTSEATNLVSGDTNGAMDLIIFSSVSISNPTVSTTSASSITTTTAVLTGNITDTGGEANTERGFDIGTDTSYTMTDVADPTGSYSTGSYSLTATGLTCGTMYHYRAYSTNTAGTGTGSNDTFTTSACPSSGGSSGSSASSRASNLINMGKIKEAQEIISQFPTQTQNVNTNTNPTAPKPTNTRTVRKGNRNNEVKYIQEYLKIKADGIFGPKTEKAVKDFQKQNNLKVDGIVGPLTWKVINKQ